MIFGYNGRDGVITDGNGLIYMRARYYSPEMKRFINADIVAGQLSNAITLNRFAYANGNHVSFVDPFGLSAERMFGAAYYDKHSVKTIDEEFDLTFGINLLRVAYTQTLSNSAMLGSTGKIAGVYAYGDYNLNGDHSVGAGLELLNSLGLELSAMLLGLGAELSIGTDDFSFFLGLSVDLLGDTTASVGVVRSTPDGTQISDELSIKGNTLLVLSVVSTIMIGIPLTENIQNPGVLPNPSPA